MFGFITIEIILGLLFSLCKGHGKPKVFFMLEFLKLSFFSVFL